MPEDPNALISVADYRLIAGHPAGDTANDEAIAKAIAFVSETIRRYTDRDFKAAQVTETRSYAYSGGRYINIDDCALITAVKIDGQALGAGAYFARPHGEEVFHYIELKEPYGRLPQSPEMGFTSNRDRLRPAPGGTVYVEVTASFGWPTVPEDVQLAAVEMVSDVLTLPGGEGPEGAFVSESIAEYTYSRENRETYGRWTFRALSTLDYYRRVNI